MNPGWKARLDAVLRAGEILGLYFTTLLLIALEFGFVYWLNRINIPGTANRPEPGFIAMPPWYEEPRFEVTILLTVMAGTVFHACRGVRNMWRHGADAASRQHAMELLKQRLATAAGVAALTGLDLAIVTLVRA